MKIVNAARFALALPLLLSLCACFPELDWREFHSAEGRYEVLLPGKVQEEVRSLGTTAGAVSMHMAAVRVSAWQFGVAWSDYPATAALEPERLIDTQRDALLRNVAGRTVAERSAPLRMRPGRLVVVEGKANDGVAVLHARFVVDGTRLYQVVATGIKGGSPEAGVETFFDSFKLSER